MKKFLLYSVVSVLFCSCQISFWTAVKYSPEVVKEISFASKYRRMEKKTEITYYYGKKDPFVLDNKTIFIPCKINDTTHLVPYNCGDTYAVFGERISGNVEFPKTNKTVKERTIIRGVFEKKGLKYYNIKSNFFDFKPYIGLLTSLSNDSIISKCTSENNKNRFHFGRNAFPKWKDVMLLSFSDTSITLLDSLGQYDTTGFTSVKSMFTCQGYLVCLMIDSIEYEFVFNTGNEGFLSIPQYDIYYKNGKYNYIYSNPEHEKHKKDNDVSLKYIDNNIGIDTMIVQQTNTITFGDLDFITGNVFYTKDFFQPVMGMAFISQFDWIIDRYKEKIYAKKIKEVDKKDVSFNYYQVNVFDTTLQISLLPVYETEYQLFSIIDSVNGEKVNANNICQMKDLLNKRNGFKDNRIGVLHHHF